MIRLLAVGVVLAIASSAMADDKDKPKPNVLTPKEIADGWVLLFDGETTFGWKIDGTAEVKDGALIFGKKKTIAYSTTSCATCDLEFEAQGSGSMWFSGELGWQPVKTVEGKWTTQELKLLRLAPPKRADTPGHAYIPIMFESGDDSILKIRSVKLRPTKTTALFTGKNLDGWKINASDPKRMASKWEVTKDGELSLKNGPGDLVTEKEFDNFVLQVECKTNGMALNSGVFFRCIPGQYQNGYEAQIHNGFKDNDRTKPTDFGTGAIYRRVPARKVVSNDNEWFTMTVMAYGKHLATWVNGYQTVDWTDDRKENENPRQGFRAAKGPISLQGHDATTDILFRNIRIAELPK
jgi:hypothetical protein